MLAASLLLRGLALAETGASVLIESDQRFRGVSLSANRPSVRAGLAWDGAGGWYAGASAAPLVLGESARRRVAVTGYAGYAVRGADGTGWELGATASHFDARARYDYQELYAALLGERWNARLYLSPDYFGNGGPTAYAELNGGIELRRSLRAVAHVGSLRPFGHDASSRADARLGIAHSFASTEWQLAWVGSWHAGPYPTAYEGRRMRWVASASLAW